MASFPQRNPALIIHAHMEGSYQYLTRPYDIACTLEEERLAFLAARICFGHHEYVSHQILGLYEIL